MISVIFLNFNRCVDLKRSLSKIFNQTGVDFEVIVVDQNSNDGSQKMIKELFPKVILHEIGENLGVAGGRNYGATIAKGEYLVFIDDDAEFVSINALKKVELVFDNNPMFNIIGFNVNGHPERPEKHLFFSHKKDRFTNGYIGCGHAIRKDVFENLGGYSGNLFFWGEEIEFAIKTFSIPGNKIIFKGDIVLFHRVSPTQRLKWSDGRFYYKVRNRLALTKDLLPFPISFLLILYYLSIYFIRALQVKCIKPYFRAAKDFLMFKTNGERLNLNQALLYLTNR